MKSCSFFFIYRLSRARLIDCEWLTRTTWTAVVNLWWWWAVLESQKFCCNSFILVWKIQGKSQSAGLCLRVQFFIYNVNMSLDPNRERNPKIHDSNDEVEPPLPPTRWLLSLILVWSSLTSGSPSEERAYLPPWCQPSLRGGLIYIARISQNQSVSHHQQEHQHVQGDQRSLKDVNPEGKAMMSVTKQQLQTDHKNVNLGKPTRLDIPPIPKGKNKEKPWEKSRHRWQNWVLLYDN